MRLVFLSIALTALALAGPARAQPVEAGAMFEPRTGDAWVDTWLADINRYARTYRDPFVDEVVRYHRAPRELVEELLAQPGWTPADVYFACSLAVAVGRPCRTVAEAYARERGEGWAAVARTLGVEPGSEGFSRVKRGFVPTYQRWGRPIRADGDPRRKDPAVRSPASRPAPDGAPDGARDPSSRPR